VNILRIDKSIGYVRIRDRDIGLTQNRSSDGVLPCRTPCTICGNTHWWTILR